MADKEEAPDQETPEKSGGMGKMIMFGAIGLALLVVGVFVGPMIKNMISPPEEVAEAEVEPAAGPPIYQSLHPPLVVNFKDEFGDSHFMQVTMEVMSRDQEAINSVREHTPAIRNALIFYFGSANYEAVITREGKQQMLDEALAEIRKVMEEQTGDGAVEEAYFTSLVIQ